MDSRKLDDIINRLLECQGTPSELNLSDLEIRLLCRESGQIFLQQPNLLELEAPINICGDIRSQYCDLLRLFEIAGLPDQTKYLFLGDYVDDGKQSLETICLLLAFKMKYPCKIFLLRGDHECASVNHNYGFYKRMNDEMWEAFIHCFDCMPVAALIDKRILCMHGGLSPKLHDLNQIRNLERPTHVPDSGLLHDIIYSCPSKDDIGWAASERNGVVLYTFGPRKVKEFLHEHDLVLICCAHEVVENGYECFADANLVAIFSAPNYRGEYGNDGAVVRVDKNLEWRFEILTPPGKGQEFNHGSGSTAKLERPRRCTKMEEIRQVALAYYNNLSDKQRERAQEFFDSLDADRDGKVSPEELLDYFLQEEKVDRIVALGLFGKLDRNGDGALDFEECTMLYYLTRVRRWVTCNGCGSHLDGIRFTCVPCFESNVNGKGYNLCAICYRYKNYTHRHSNFLDNYLLLEVKRLEQIRPNQHQGSTSNAFKVYHHNNPNMGNTSNAIDVYRPNIPNRTKTELTLKAFEVLCQIGTLATSVANLATTNCSIM